MPTTPEAEPADAGQDHQVPDDLLELHQVLEWQDAVEPGQ
ncbi:MAG: hypothetical protein SHS37scaffold145_12 [Phage 71_18]|nr:MAG: hypothetical protein SHS37scaffold145_12 [Phage 71_18]